jgi:hypothetical protein
MNYLEKKKQNLRKLTVEAARPYILGKGYFHDGFVLPGKIVPGDFNINLNRINWLQRFPVPRTNSLDIIVDKSNHGIRRYSLVNPYIYWQLANEFLEDFDRIKNLLLEDTPVNVYSLPNFTDNDIGTDWSYFSRIDPSKSFWTDYKYVASADIYNFYESIYTHSIAWAIETKDAAKASRGNDLRGNRIDKLFQNAHDGQTNGIPTGNILSDLAAELILKDIDRLVANVIESEGIKAYRFRDDYRFVCKNKGQALLVTDTLAYYLSTEYGLTLNRTKTKIQTNTAYMKALASEYTFPKFLESESSIEQFSWRKFYQFIVECRAANETKRGVFDSYIEKFIDMIRASKTPLTILDDLNEWVDLIYALIIDVVESGASTSPHLYLVLDFILGKLDDAGKRDDILEDLISRINNSHNQVRVVWTYALLTHFDESKASDFSNGVDSDLLRFIVNSEAADIDKFTSRDEIPDDDKSLLRNVTIFDFEFINSVDSISIEELLLNSINEDLYESISLSRYLNR